MRILITGSRNWAAEATIASALQQVWAEAGRPKQVTVIHGACPYGGADALAAQAARQYGWDVEEHAADWRRHGRRAGPMRNQAMVDAGADVTLAFPLANSRGTWDCVRRARAAGIPVHVVPE